MPDETRDQRHVDDASEGLTEAARFLASHGADVNAQDGEGMTALAWAAKVDPGHTAILEALLAAGADPTIASQDGRTPLQWAEYFGHESLAKHLRAATPGG